MKFRTTYVLLGIVVLLAIIVVLTRGDGEAPQRGPVALNQPLFPAFARDKAAKILLTREAKEIVMEKRGSTWWLVTPIEFHADSKAVQTLLEKIGGIKPAEIISTNPDKHQLFEVDEKGLKVAIQDAASNALATFTLGKRSADMTSTYLRTGNAKAVLLVPQVLKYTFDKDAKNWRERAIFAFDKESARRITLDDGVVKIALERDDSGAWRIREPEEAPASQNAVNALVRSLSNLRASDLDDDATLESAGLDNPMSTITVGTSEGETLTLHIGKDHNKRLTFARRADRDAIYLIFKGQASALMKKFDDLREKQPAPSAASSAPLVSPARQPVPAQPKAGAAPPAAEKK